MGLSFRIENSYLLYDDTDYSQTEVPCVNVLPEVKIQTTNRKFSRMKASTNLILEHLIIQGRKTRKHYTVSQNPDKSIPKVKEITSRKVQKFFISYHERT
jgi:hypothetical protein